MRVGINDLVELLDNPRAVLERAIYFALAGRGIGLGIAHLRWFAVLLDAQDHSNWPKAGRTYLHFPDLRVDVTKLHFGPSLAFRVLHEVSIEALDADLLRLSLNPRSPVLLRFFACLSIGVHPVFAREAAEELYNAIEQFGETGRYASSRLSVILSHEGCDYQRALYFGAVAFRHFAQENRLELEEYHPERQVLGALKLLVEALTCRRDRFEGTAQVGRFPPASPYLCDDQAESCVFCGHA